MRLKYQWWSGLVAAVLGGLVGVTADVSTAPWLRGMLRGLLMAEALRTAMGHFGHQPLTGTQV